MLHTLHKLHHAAYTLHHSQVSRPDRILVSSGGTWELQSMELLGRGPSDFEGYIAEILWLRLKASVTVILFFFLLPFAVFRLPSSFFLLHYPGPW